MKAPQPRLRRRRTPTRVKDVEKCPNWAKSKQPQQTFFSVSFLSFLPSCQRHDTHITHILCPPLPCPIPHTHTCMMLGQPPIPCHHTDRHWNVAAWKEPWKRQCRPVSVTVTGSGVGGWRHPGPGGCRLSDRPTRSCRPTTPGTVCVCVAV